MNLRIHIPVLLLLLLSVTPSVYGQAGMLRVSEVTVTETDETTAVSFTAEVNDLAIGRNSVYAFQPVLTDGTYTVSLPPVVLTGKNVRKSLRNSVQDAVQAVSNKAIRYTAAVEAQEWMHGGRLYIESTVGECDTEYRLPDLTLSENLRLREEPAATEIVTEVRRFVPRTLGDSLSTMFTFVVPEAMFDPEDPFRIYDEERQQALIVYFDLGKHDINPEFRNNRQTLINLTAVTEMILDDPHSRVERVVVAGFASPEGTFRFNDILSFRRAAAIKHYLLQTTGLQDEQVWTYNGSVDWRGLRLLVEQSDMPQKERILRLLESTSGEAQRLERLKQLDDGAPYRYLFDEVFPLLRNGAFIKVYYSNTPKE